MLENPAHWKIVNTHVNNWAKTAESSLSRPLARIRAATGLRACNPTSRLNMNPTLFALTGFIAWSLSLLVLMEVIRSKLVLTKSVAANGFTPDNAKLSPFMQRLARAHANCLEGLPIFGGLMLVAAVSGNTAITDPLACWFLAARIVQSAIHLSSLSALAVILRFSAFAVQMAIGVYWAARLLAA